MKMILNEEIRQELIRSSFGKITNYISDMCEFAVKDYQLKQKKFPNYEPSISGILVEEYLRDRQNYCGMSGYQFDTEIPEHYMGNGEYAGRVDIRILLPNNFLAKNAYYIIECKRIDGSNSLNKKYVDEGIERFISGKYTSYYGKNIMLGYVVKNIDIAANTGQIEGIQNSKPDSCIHGDFEFMERKGITDYYTCIYHNVSPELKLVHMFSDFSSVVS